MCVSLDTFWKNPRHLNILFLYKRKFRKKGVLQPPLGWNCPILTFLSSTEYKSYCTALWVMNSTLSFELSSRRRNVAIISLICSYFPGRYSGELHSLTPAGQISRLGPDMLLKMSRRIFILCQASSEQLLHCGTVFRLDVSFITANLISSNLQSTVIYHNYICSWYATTYLPFINHLPWAVSVLGER